MSAQFTIVPVAHRNLLDVVMSGFYSVPDVDRYHRAVTDASERLGGDPAL